MNRGIRYQLIILILSIGVIPIILTGIFLAWQGWRTQVQQSLEYQREIGFRAKNRIQSFIHIADDHLGLVPTLFDLPKLPSASQQEILSLLAAHRDETHNRVFKDLALFDAKAAPLACFSRTNRCSGSFLEDVFALEIIKEALATGHETFGPILFDSDKGTPTILLARPIFHPAHPRPQGVIAGNIRFKELWKILNDLSNRPHVLSYLLNDKGRVVGHPNPSVVLRETFLNHPGEEGVRKGLLNRWSVLVTHPISFGKQQFILVVERPLMQALSVTIQAMSAIALMAVVTCISAFFLAFMMAQKFVQPIQRLTVKTKQISHGDPVQWVGMEREDEIGLLTQSFYSMNAAIEEQVRSLNQLVNEKERALQALSESYAEMEELSYITSHHLQEPVRVLVNYIDLLEQKYNDRLDDSGRRYLFHIRQKGMLFKTLLSDVMEYLSLNQISVDRTAVDLSTVVSHAASAVLQKEKDRKAIIDMDNLPVIHTDGKLLKRVFLQVFENSLRYNDKPEPHVQVTVERKSDGWVISVCDNGIGVDAEFRKKIFKLFNRLHRPEEYPGTGIGLALCRKIISMLGGQWIRMESNENGGACVTFHLPEKEKGEE